LSMTDIEKRAKKVGIALPDLNGLPKRAPRTELARLITQYYFQVSPRTLERWAISWLTLNNRAHGDVAEAFAIAQQKLDEATPIRGGQSDTRGSTKPDPTPVR
jgi:hypothetical protein